MQCRASVVREAPGKYETVTVDVEDPRQGELRIKLVATGVCHSDDHIATGDIPVEVYPMVGGHEGAGVIESVGPNTPGFEVGDKIVCSFIPSCGKCRWCATGHQNLCDLGAGLARGTRWNEDSTRVHLPDGTSVGQLCGLGAFSEYTTISVDSAIKVPQETRLEVACLLACGVGTGWGAAVNTGEVGPGDTVIIQGVGGIGANAVQGAAHAGAATVIAVDPVAFKREKAQEFGADHAVATMEEATEIARSLTNGQGADVSIVTVGVTSGEHVALAFASIRKRGTVIVTGLGDVTAVGLPIALGDLTLLEKRIKGSLFGSSNPTADIPRMLDLYKRGQIKLDELVTRNYRLDDIAQAYEDQHAGQLIRGVVLFD